MGRLYIEDDLGNIKILPIEKDVLTIGRADDNDVVLKERNVSRHHARLVKTDEGFVLEDAGSRYGIKVDGERVERRCEFPPGRVALVGDFKLKVLEETRRQTARGIATTGVADAAADESQQVSVADELPEVYRAPRRKRNVAGTLALAGLLVLAGILALVYFSLVSESPEIATPGGTETLASKGRKETSESGKALPVSQARRSSHQAATGRTRLAPGSEEPPTQPRALAGPRKGPGAVASATEGRVSSRHHVEPRKAQESRHGRVAVQSRKARRKTHEVASVSHNRRPHRSSARAVKRKPATGVKDSKALPGGTDVVGQVEQALGGGDLARAEKLLQKCRGRRCARLWYRLGTKYEGRANRGGAIRAYQRAKRLSKDPFLRARVRKRLELLTKP